MIHTSRRAARDVRRHSRVATACFGTVVLGLVMASPAGASGDQVVVHRGSPIEIAVVLDHSGILSDAGMSARKAVQMAVDKHPLIRGYGVQLNDYDGPCGNPPANAAAAAQVVANPRNVVVIGHMCSTGEHAALPIYEQSGLVTMSGSATDPLNPPFGPHMFNSVIVPDDTPGESDAWYSRVQQLPRDVSWRADYAARFGSKPGPFADLYFDAASVILEEIATASTKVHGDLVIDRSALATAVRTLSGSPDRGFKGVTCWIKLDSRGYRVNDPASLDRCGKESGRVVETSAFTVAWSATDPEEIDSLVWRGISMTNTGTVSGLPPGCHFAEYFGNSWSVAHYPFMLVGDSVGTWDRSGRNIVRISSRSAGCEGSTGIGVQTMYTFADHGPGVDSIRVARTFSFGSSPADFDIRPYIPRLSPRDIYNQVLHPNAGGTALVRDSISPCEFGCEVVNWNGTWFASNDPRTGRGVILLRENGAASSLWIDMDAASMTTASSALLKRPAGGFTGTLVETQTLCFYDSTTWPASARTTLTLPSGCARDRPVRLG